MLEVSQAFAPSQTYTLTDEERDKIKRIVCDSENIFQLYITLVDNQSLNFLFNDWEGLSICIQIELHCLRQIELYYDNMTNGNSCIRIFSATFLGTIPFNIFLKEKDENYSRNFIIYLTKYFLKAYEALIEFEYQRCLIAPYIQRILTYIYYSLTKKYYLKLSNSIKIMIAHPVNTGFLNTLVY